MGSQKRMESLKLVDSVYFHQEKWAERREELLTTHLQADPVFWISLLAFRRGEHWRDRHIKTRRGGEWKRQKDNMCEEEEGKCVGERERQKKGGTHGGFLSLCGKQTEGWGTRSLTVKWQWYKQMIPSPGTKDREVKELWREHTKTHTHTSPLQCTGSHFNVVLLHS